MTNAKRETGGGFVSRRACETVEVGCEKTTTKKREVEKAGVIWQQKTCYLETETGYLGAKNGYLEYV